jgi:nucleoside-diphosphate-sugar epimerase
MDLNRKRILVTGAAGFIGANLLRRLAASFDSVLYGLDLKNTCLWRVKDLTNSEKVRIYGADIANARDVSQVFESVNPEVVFHCAVYGMYVSKETDKALMIDTNIKGVLNLVTAAMKVGTRKFINTGTNSEYGPKNRTMSESMVLEPDNTYGMTKAGQTLLASQLAREYRLDLVTLRLFAPYGPYETKTRLIPSIILTYIDGQKPKLSSSKSVRNFTYVEDVTDAYIKAAEADGIAKGEIINAGSGRQYSISDVVSAVKRIMGLDIDPEWGRVNSVQTEPKVFKANNTKARTLLGWKPVHNLKQGLTKTIDWFRKNQNLYHN